MIDGSEHEAARASRADRGDASAGSGLSLSTIMAARRVLHAYREGWLLESRLEAVAEMIAADARRSGVSAEQMLVSWKRCWQGLEEVAALHITERRELLNRLVALYIDAYYQGEERADAAAQKRGLDVRSAG